MMEDDDIEEGEEIVKAMIELPVKGRANEEEQWCLILLVSILICQSLCGCRCRDGILFS